MKRLPKKIKIIISIICVFLICSFLCVYSYGTFEISQLNQNSSLSVDLLEKKSNIDLQKYSLSPTEEMSGGSYYLHEDGCHRIYTSSYPDALFFSSCVTAISVEKGCEDNVLGISIGTSTRVIYEILDKYNYKLLKGSDDFIVAEKGKIKIIVTLSDGGSAQSITVSLKTSNISGLNF